MNKERPKTKCPRCGVDLRVDRLKKHIHKVHSGSKGKENKSKKAKARRSPAFRGKGYSIRTCPFCGTSMYKCHLEDHIDQFHPIRPKSKPKRKPKYSAGTHGKTDRSEVTKGKTFVIDKSGFITDPNLLKENPEPSTPWYERRQPGARTKEKNYTKQNTFQKIGQIKEGPAKIRPSLIAFNQNTFVNCPICRSRIKCKNIRRHARKIHPGGSLKYIFTNVEKQLEKK